MRVVIDTNVMLVITSRKNPYYFVFDAFLKGRYDVCISYDILFEYEEQFSKRLESNELDRIFKVLLNCPFICFTDYYYRWHLITQDPDDDKMVDCAVAAKADFIVSNDRHFDVLAQIEFPKVKVLRLEEFARILREQMP